MAGSAEGEDGVAVVVDVKDETGGSKSSDKMGNEEDGDGRGGLREGVRGRG